MMLLALLPFAHAAALPAPSGVVATAHAPRRVAVVVGVQDYADPALRGLRWAEKDAADVARVLGSADVGGFSSVEVLSGAALTSREALWSALRRVTDSLGRDDTFLLYLSGHGTLTLDPTAGTRLWFLPSDGRLDAPESTGVSIEELEAWVNELPARRRVLVLDTCHNGRVGSKSSLTAATTTRLGELRGEPPSPRPGREVSESEARLYAAQYHQPAMEDPELQNGVYTHFLLDGLTAGRTVADLDRDGLVDVAEAHAYARDRTIARTGGAQVPRAEYRIVGREEIYLSGRPDSRSTAERALATAYDAVLSRARLLIDGTPRGELPGLYAVEPGVRDVEIRAADGRTVVKRKHRFVAGNMTALEDLLAERRSSVGVALGVSATDAEGWEGFAPSLMLTVAQPVRTSGNLRWDLHLAASGFGAEWEATRGYAGDATLGTTVGTYAGPMWFGATVGARAPWRSALAEATTTPDPTPKNLPQAYLTGSAGLAAGAEVPLGAGRVVTFRLDGWGTPTQWDGRWELSAGGAARVGVAFRD